MPTSNGQITSRDLRQKIIRSVHMTPAVIDDSDFLEDQIVTYPDKLDDPVWASTFHEPSFHNASLTTTPQTFTPATFDVPAWVDRISVLALGKFQLTNTSGAEVTVYPGIEIEGEVISGATFEIPDASTKSVMVADVEDMSGVAGSTISVAMEIFLSTGTNSSNKGDVYGIVVGSR